MRVTIRNRRWRKLSLIPTRLWFCAPFLEALSLHRLKSVMKNAKKLLSRKSKLTLLKKGLWKINYDKKKKKWYFAGVAVTFTFLFHLTFFAGCVAVSGYCEQNNLHSVVCYPVQPLSKSGKALHTQLSSCEHFTPLQFPFSIFNCLFAI